MTKRSSSKKPKSDIEWVTVRVPADAYELAQKLLANASQGGWAVFKSERIDRPTLGTIFDEGLKALQSRM